MIYWMSKLCIFTISLKIDVNFDYATLYLNNNYKVKNRNRVK